MSDLNDQTQNVSIHNDVTDADVTTTTDGSKERLDVSSKDSAALLADEGRIFVSVIDTITLGAGSAETHVFMLKNPVSSGIQIKIEEYVFVTVQSSQSIIFRIYKNPTFSADGAALAEINKADLTVNATATAHQEPTVSDTGTQLNVFGAGAESEIRHIEAFTLFINEDEELLITAEPQAANQTVGVNVTWAEVDL